MKCLLFSRVEKCEIGLKTRESVGNGRNRVETRKVGFNVEKPNGVIGQPYWFVSSSSFVASVHFASGQYLVWPRQVACASPGQVSDCSQQSYHIGVYVYKNRSAALFGV